MKSGKVLAGYAIVDTKRQSSFLNFHRTSTRATFSHYGIDVF
ncbi:MAG TPA: hypothetical protein VLA60_04530 [Nitrospirales bacterium]|nr:hypothetical protein [Nitrospirales bacterium]